MINLRKGNEIATAKARQHFLFAMASHGASEIRNVYLLHFRVLIVDSIPNIAVFFFWKYSPVSSYFFRLKLFVMGAQTIAERVLFHFTQTSLCRQNMSF
jgi:hypothetical protein